MKQIRKIRKQYDGQILEEAVREAKKVKNIRDTSKKYNIPFTTLYRRLKNEKRKERPGPDPVLLHEEEERIKNWVFYMARAGFPVCQIDVTHTVKDYADKIRRRNDREIPNSFPSKYKHVCLTISGLTILCVVGKNWSQRFIARHPEIHQKLVNNLSKAGAKVTEPQLRNWFFEVEELLRQDGIDTSIFDNPERILNFDESGFQLVPKRYKALCSDAENTYLVTSNSEKDCYTALFGSTAAGDLTPPMILYPGKRISRDMVENVPDGWSIGVSDEGWQTSKTFYEYIANDLYQWLQKRGTEFPVLIFVDGHKSHVNMELVEFCIQKGLILVSLYPNSTRILQPLDRNFFGPLKQIWSKVLRQNLLKNSNARIN